MPRPITVVYKTIDRCDIRVDVYRPDRPDQPTPVVTYIHGGCLMYGSRKGIHLHQLELYLEAGFAVVSIDYCLAPETKLPAIIEDVRDAFRWIRGEAASILALDPGRLGAVGHSAGGYLALMAGHCVHPHPNAIVAFYGYGDIVADWYSKPDPFYCQSPRVSEEAAGVDRRGPIVSESYEGRGKDQFYLYCRQRGLWPREVSGHDPETEPGFFVPYCPVQNVSAEYPPTLLLHGDQDTDVPYSQSVQMAEALSHAGVEHELITVTGSGHGFDRQMDDPTVRSCFDRVLTFLCQHVAGVGHSRVL